MWPGLFGLILGGPVGWVAGMAVGAGADAVAAKVVDFGLPDEWVCWFRDAVQPRTATVALLVEDLDRDAFIAAARFTGAELVYANLDDATIERVKGAFATRAPTVGSVPWPQGTAPPQEQLAGGARLDGAWSGW